MRRHAKLKLVRVSAHGAKSGRSVRKRASMARISGRVLSASKGKVAIEIDRLVKGHWVAVRRITASVSSSGRFAQTLALQATSRYRVRATYTGATGYRPSSSKYRLVVLHGR